MRTKSKGDLILSIPIKVSSWHIEGSQVWVNPLLRSGPATQLLSASFLNSSSMTKNDIVLTKWKWNHISENCFEFLSAARDGNDGGSNWTRTSTIEIAEFIFNSPSNLETRICRFKKIIIGFPFKHQRQGWECQLNIVLSSFNARKWTESVFATKPLHKEFDIARKEQFCYTLRLFEYTPNTGSFRHCEKTPDRHQHNWSSIIPQLVHAKLTHNSEILNILTGETSQASLITYTSAHCLPSYDKLSDQWHVSVPPCPQNSDG